MAMTGQLGFLDMTLSPRGILYGYFLAIRESAVTASPRQGCHRLVMRAAGRQRSEFSSEIPFAFLPTQLSIDNAADSSNFTCRRRTSHHIASGPGAQPAGQHACTIDAERVADARRDHAAQRASGMAAVPYFVCDPA